MNANLATESSLHACTVRLSSGGERAFYFRAGTSDDEVIDHVFAKNRYDLRHLDRTPEQHRHADILAFLDRTRRQSGKHPLIVDAGANIGASALYFVSEFSGALILAIEPDASNFALLQRNIAGLPVGCIHGAASAWPGRARVIDPGEGHSGYRTEVADDGDVPCVPIAELFGRYAGTHFPFIVKIDIQGSEAELFSANTEWVAQTPILIVEPHDCLIPNAAISRNFLKCISALNRDLLIVGEHIYSIANDRLDKPADGQSRSRAVSRD